jgi:hypothetical protein
MNDSLARTLYSYLLQQQRLPIPGLGMVLIERVPAQKDTVEKKLNPPAFKFRFDQYFDAPDTDFFNFLAQEQGIPEHEAMQRYNQWSFDLRNSMQVDQPMPLGAYAHFIKKSNGELLFETERPINPFFTRVPAERVTTRAMNLDEPPPSHVEEGVDEVTASFPELGEEEKASWVWFALVLFAGTAVLLFFHFHRLGWHLSSTGLQYLR